MTKSKLINIGVGNLDKLSKKLQHNYEILVGLPNSGQRYPYRAYEYGSQKKKGAKKQSAKAKTKIDTSDKPLPLVAQVGFWAEFGTETEPERSFLRKTILKFRKKYLEINKQIAIKVLRGELELEKGLRKFALLAQDDVKEAIRTWEDPPNAASTIKKKGVNSPLQYKGTLLRAIVGLLRKK